MGEVYEAIHQATGRVVAVKVLTLAATNENDTATASDSVSEVTARFTREARATGQVSSPHVVEVLDAGLDETSQRPFMVMEYLVGEDLHRLQRRLGCLPVEASLRIIGQACSGLAKAHAAGVIHRDVKPANLFIAQREDGITVKVVDFGIARLKRQGEADLTQDLTRTGSLLGSPTYMAPEQARGAKEVDGRADVWSLGVVLYKLLCGMTPFANKEGALGELLVSICCQPSPSIQDRAPWVPSPVAQLVHECLTIDPDKRIPSVQAMNARIGELLGDTSMALQSSMLRSMTDNEKANVAERAQLNVNVAPAIPPPSRSPRWLMRAASGVGVLVALTGVAIALRSRSSAPAIESSFALTEVKLAVPADVQVSVEGAELEVHDGSVLLRGRDGASKLVTLKGPGSDAQDFVVALLGGRAYPPSLSLRSVTPEMHSAPVVVAAQPTAPPSALAKREPAAPSLTSRTVRTAAVPSLKTAAAVSTTRGPKDGLMDKFE
jgi:eukaryotic-like serine/threonine-protein kinase